MNRILVFHRDHERRAELSEILSAAGYWVRSTGVAKEAVRFVQLSTFHLLLTEADPPAGLDRLKSRLAIIPIPPEPDRLIARVESVLDIKRARDERTILREDLKHPLIAVDHRMRETLRRARELARENCAITLAGEPGVGKRTLARFIHSVSCRKDSAFAAVSCRAAQPDIARCIELAHGGTVYFQDSGKLHPGTKKRISRLIENQCFAGGNKSIYSDVRIIADGDNALPPGARRLEIPPLRERPADIVPLAHYFLSQARRDVIFTPDALSQMRSYAWPANVRELRLVVERAALLCERFVASADLRLDVAAAANSLRSLEDIEREAMEKALESHGQNRTHAAEQLGISVRTLQYRLKRYGINSPRGHV